MKGVAFLVLFVCLPLVVGAQEGAAVDGRPGVRLEAGSPLGSPVWDLSYGPLSEQRLDLWLPNAGRKPHPVAVWFHGGGFGQGDKNGLSPALRDALLERGIAVASVNYRLAPRAHFPAPMEDAARSVQFLRSQAEQFGLDTAHFAALGRSAGGALALWVAYNEDLATLGAPDPVLRASSLVQSVAVINAQTTFQADEIQSLFGVKHPPRFFANLLGEHPSAEEAALASPLSAFGPGDPPTLFVYLLPRGKGGGARSDRITHSPKFAEPVQEKALRWGVDVKVVKTPERNVLSAYENIAQFLARQLETNSKEKSVGREYLRP